MLLRQAGRLALTVGFLMPPEKTIVCSHRSKGYAHQPWLSRAQFF